MPAGKTTVRLDVEVEQEIAKLLETKFRGTNFRALVHMLLWRQIESEKSSPMADVRRESIGPVALSPQTLQAEPTVPTPPPVAESLLKIPRSAARKRAATEAKGTTEPTSESKRSPSVDGKLESGQPSDKSGVAPIRHLPPAPTEKSPSTGFSTMRIRDNLMSAFVSEQVYDRPLDYQLEWLKHRASEAGLNLSDREAGQLRDQIRTEVLKRRGTT